MKEEIGSSWWDKNYKDTSFRNWLGGTDCPSRNELYEIVKDYNSVLDCACGICLDYFKYKKEGLGIKYKGVDSCQGLVDEAKGKEIDVELADIENLPFEDNSFEVVTGRHILEHLPDFEKALREMSRVANKLVVVIFFLPPAEDENIGLDDALQKQVNLNTYSKKKVEAVAQELGGFDWKPVGNEIILTIHKK